MSCTVQGDISSFDSYHKRNKISYDDGEEMWVALQRETFTWITPRALGAGADLALCPSCASVAKLCLAVGSAFECSTYRVVAILPARVSP